MLAWSFCRRILILFANGGPKSSFKAVCDQKSFILCWYRARMTLNNRVMWTVLDLSMLVSIASRFPPGPLEAEWPIHEPVFASTRNYRQRIFMSPYQERHARGEFCLSHCLRQRILPTIHQFIPLSIHPYACMSACTDIVYRCPCFPLCYGWRVGIV